MSSTEGMSRGYDAHSEYQRAVAQTGTSLVDDCVAALEIPDAPSPVVLVDLGAATGQNSLAVMAYAVRAIRRREAEAAVVCVHNDVLTNDWSRLFDNVANSSDSYLAGQGPAVLPMASAGSFFEQTVPAGFAHIQMSFSAAHWLRDQPPVSVPEGFYSCEATGEARSLLAEQAAADWRAFLGARAADLAPGGQLIVQCVGTHVDGGTEHVTARELLAAMASSAKTMADDGLLDPAAVESYVFPVYARTVDEARAPFQEAGSPLEIIDVSTAPVANPYLDRWRQDGDAETYARDYTAFVRGFSESALRKGLFAPAAENKGDVDRLVDEYFDRLQARFADRPEADAFRDWTLTVVARRVRGS